MSYSISTITDWADVGPLARWWDEMSADNFMVSPTWMGNWWQAYGDRDHSTEPRQWGNPKLAIAEFRDQDGNCCGFVPGYVCKTLLGRTFRLLASGMVCSDYVRFPSKPSYATDIGQIAAQWITSSQFRSQFGRIDAIEIEGYTSDELTIRYFLSNLEAQGWTIQSRPIEGAWRTHLPGTWEGFEKSLHKSRRRKVNKAKRLISDGAVTYSVYKTLAQFEAFWPTFVDLHQKRRKAIGQAGCFSDKRFFDFLSNTTRTMIGAGQAWFSVLHHRDHEIAAGLIFASQRTAFMYQSGMDPDWSSLEPGHLINTYTIQTVIESGFEVFDFLRGDEPYKEGWNCHRVSLFRVRAAAPHLLSQLRHSAISAGQSIKNWAGNWSNLNRT